MSIRRVRFNEIKETKTNLALLNRPRQRTTKNLMMDQTPSANFESQWGISKQGYNLNAPPNYIAAPIINPNAQNPQRIEFNEPYRVPRPEGWYSPAGRGNMTVYSTNNLASLVPEEHKHGYYMRSKVLPFREPKASNGSPVPLPRTWRRQDKLRNAANANELLRNINRTVHSRRRQNKSKRSRKAKK